MGFRISFTCPGKHPQLNHYAFLDALVINIRDLDGFEMVKRRTKKLRRITFIERTRLEIVIVTPISD